MLNQSLIDDDDKFGFVDCESDFERITHDSLGNEKYKQCKQASHCMIFSKSGMSVLDVYNSRALILMQFRFDGHLGFPGGIVDPGENPEEALNRELSEENGLTSLIQFTLQDRMLIHYNSSKCLLLHFFVKEVSPEIFREIELISIKASEYGNEVLGVIRVPLYTMTDGYRGFPAFLQNKFIGNSKQQLLQSLKQLGIISEEEINKATSAVPLIRKILLG